jgi:ubiquinone/menaquinone biosynthesis C-methylase UbiE
MNKMQDIETLKQQYKNAQNLETRISLHDKYSTNKQGFGNWFFEKFNAFNGCKILELGCGNGGMWCDRIPTIGEDSLLVLSDFSNGMLKEAKLKVGAHINVGYTQIDITNIPFDTSEFDFVIANMMLYHVPDLPAAIKEVRRVLDPSGIFFCATFGENGLNHYINMALEEQGFQIKIKGAFTLQNGMEILGKDFTSVYRLDYIDSFEISDTNDLLDYIFSLSSLVGAKDLERNELFHFFEKQKNATGIIQIPKEYGMFVSK